MDDPLRFLDLSKPSIYDHILAHLDPVSGRLLEEGAYLPDEETHYGVNVP